MAGVWKSQLVVGFLLFNALGAEAKDMHDGTQGSIGLCDRLPIAGKQTWPRLVETSAKDNGMARTHLYGRRWTTCIVAWTG